MLELGTKAPDFKLFDTISGNQITAQTTAISLNGTTKVQISNNLVNLDGEEPKPLVAKRTTELKSDLE